MQLAAQLSTNILDVPPSPNSAAESQSVLSLTQLPLSRPRRHRPHSHASLESARLGYQMHTVAGTARGISLRLHIHGIFHAVFKHHHCCEAECCVTVIKSFGTCTRAVLAGIIQGGKQRDHRSPHATILFRLHVQQTGLPVYIPCLSHTRPFASALRHT